MDGSFIEEGYVPHNNILRPWEAEHQWKIELPLPVQRYLQFTLYPSLITSPLFLLDFLCRYLIQNFPIQSNYLTIKDTVLKHCFCNLTVKSRNAVKSQGEIILRMESGYKNFITTGVQSAESKATIYQLNSKGIQAKVAKTL